MNSETQRAAARATLAKVLRDPAVEQRRRDGCRRACQNPETFRKRSEAAKRSWLLRERREMSAEEMAAKAELMARLNVDPEFQAKRRRAAAKAEACPKVKAKRVVVARANRDKLRGFAVPARLWKDYQHLRVSKGLGAREAGRILGLLP